MSQRNINQQLDGMDYDLSINPFYRPRVYKIAIKRFGLRKLTRTNKKSAKA